MVIKLVVDSRECGVLEVLSRKEQQPEVEYERESLPLGDFVFKDDTVHHLIIERKTYEDLAASIVDGRFREQKSRLSEMKANGSRVMYVIEGNYRGYKGKVPMTTLVSAILNLMLVHNFMVMFSSDTSNTVDILLSIKSKLESTGNTELGQTQSVVMKMPSRGDKVRENLFLMQMMVIPGVSQKIGESICSRYSCMADLVEALKESGEHLLADIQLTEKRKLGKALSSKIYKAMMSTVSPDDSK